jgi:hypothetical protein
MFLTSLSILTIFLYEYILIVDHLGTYFLRLTILDIFLHYLTVTNFCLQFLLHLFNHVLKYLQMRVKTSMLAKYVMIIKCQKEFQGSFCLAAQVMKKSNRKLDLISRNRFYHK